MAENGYANAVLVTTEWLAEHLGDEDLVVAEVDEDPDLYDEAHPALKLHWRDDLQDPVERDVVDKETFEQRLLGGRGIRNSTAVVLYGDKNNWFAAYAYWYLKIYGHGDVQFSTAAGGSGSTRAASSRRTPPLAKRPLHRAGTGRVDPCLPRQVREWLEPGEPAMALVDVRSPGEYAGDLIAPPGYEQEGAQRAGTSRPPSRSPGRAPCGTTAPSRRPTSFASSTPARESRTSSRSRPTAGSASAAPTWFVLRELLGYEDVRNYDGSWTGGATSSTSRSRRASEPPKPRRVPPAGAPRRSIDEPGVRSQSRRSTTTPRASPSASSPGASHAARGTSVAERRFAAEHLDHVRRLLVHEPQPRGHVRLLRHGAERRGSRSRRGASFTTPATRRRAGTGRSHSSRGRSRPACCRCEARDQGRGGRPVGPPSRPSPGSRAASWARFASGTSRVRGGRRASRGAACPTSPSAGPSTPRSPRAPRFSLGTSPS